MTPVEEYIIGLSSEKLIRYITVEKSLHSSKELSIAVNEAKKRGIDPENPVKASEDDAKLFKEFKNDYYKIDERSENDYMTDNMNASARIANGYYNPFAAKTVTNEEMNKTTFLMTIASLTPILVGMVVFGLLRPGQTNLALGLTIIWFLDAVICLIDCRLLSSHKYEVGKLWIFAFLLTPLYMVFRAKLLKEKNNYVIVWCILLLIFIYMSP